MREPVIGTLYMIKMMWKGWLLVSCVVALLISYRTYTVLHREIPPELENPMLVRWLDELGRVGNAMMSICHQLGIEAATRPAKFLVNTGARLLLNGFGDKLSNITIRYTSVDGVPVTIFLPDGLPAEDMQPTMVYFHGGGWTWLSVDVYAGYLAHLASRTKLQIAAVGYRTAPQDRFPAAFDDALAVTKGLLKRTRQFKIAKDAVIVAGDGSGANIAAAVAHALKRKLRMQILINPTLQCMDFSTPSYRDNANVLPGLSSAFRNVYHWLTYAGISKDFLQISLQNEHASKSVLNSVFSTYIDSKKYLPDYHKVTKRKTNVKRKSNFIVSSAFNSVIADPRFSPMMAVDIEGVPNLYMITSQYDVYRDEAIMYTHRLHDAGIKVKLEHYKDAFHGFFLFNGFGPIKFDVSVKALDHLADFIQDHVHRDSVLQQTTASKS